MTQNTYEQDVLKAIKYHYGSSNNNDIVLQMIDYHCWVRPSAVDAFKVVSGMFIKTLNEHSEGRFMNKFIATLGENARFSLWFDTSEDFKTHADFLLDCLLSAIGLTAIVDFGPEYANLPDCDPAFEEFRKERGYA